MPNDPLLVVGRYGTLPGRSEHHMAPGSFSLVNVYRMEERAKGRKGGQNGRNVPNLPISSSKGPQRWITGREKGEKVVTSTTDGTILKLVRNNSTAGCLFAPLVASQVAVQ